MICQTVRTFQASKLFYTEVSENLESSDVKKAQSRDIWKWLKGAVALRNIFCILYLVAFGRNKTLLKTKSKGKVLTKMPLVIWNSDNACSFRLYFFLTSRWHNSKEVITLNKPLFVVIYVLSQNNFKIIHFENEVLKKQIRSLIYYIPDKRWRKTSTVCADISLLDARTLYL